MLNLYQLAQTTEMQPNRPLLYRKPIYNREQNYLQDISKHMATERLTRQAWDSQLYQIKQQQKIVHQNNAYIQNKMDALERENYYLQAKLLEEQNRAQLIENKHQFLLLQQKQHEYEQLIRQARGRSRDQDFRERIISYSHPVREPSSHSNRTPHLNGQLPPISPAPDEDLESASQYHLIRKSKVLRPVQGGIVEEAEDELSGLQQLQGYYNRKNETKSGKIEIQNLKASQKQAEVVSKVQSDRPQEKQQNIPKQVEEKPKQEQLAMIPKEVTQRKQIKRKKNPKALRRFRVYVWFIIAVMRWVVITIQTREIQEAEFASLRKCMEKNEEILRAQHQQKNIKDIKAWVGSVFNKIFRTITGEEFANRFKNQVNVNDVKQVDVRRQWICNITKFFFVNLELMTRAGNIPQTLISHCTLSLFREHQKQPSQFVATRTKYYARGCCEIADDEELMIFTETLFFDVLIKYVFELISEQKFINDQHKGEAKLQILAMTSILHIFYVKSFQDLPAITPVVKMLQRRLHIDKLEMKIVTDKKLDIVPVANLKEYNFFEKLFQTKQKWFEDLYISFSQAMNNIDAQIEL